MTTEQPPVRDVDGVACLGTILGVWAHPDDEAYLSAGIMAAAVAKGQRVACVTATRGEAGESSDPARWPPHDLLRIRGEEMAASLAALGVSDHQWLEYPDGGCVAGDPEAIERVARAIERVRPDTVLTFGPDGMTGHPDHQAVSGWAAAAFEQAAPPGGRLLFATKTPEWAERFADLNAGVFPPSPGLPPSTPVEELAVLVDLDADAELLDRKLAALAAQASQTSSLIGLVGDESYAAWVSEEAFRLGASADPGRRDGRTSEGTATAQPAT